MSGAGDNMIEAEGLARRFGHARAISAIDLRIARGEIFGLVGPDGAGKTTLLQLLAAILDPNVIVLGGSVAGAFDCFEEAVQGRIGEYLAPSAAEQLKIVASSAGAASAALGAAALIFSGHREEQ